MNDTQAMRLMSELVTTTNGWDDASVLTWTRRIIDLGDDQAARQSVDLLARTWTSPSRPTWGKFMEIYDAQPRAGDVQALPVASRWTGEEVSIEQHLANLRRWADNGDDRARRELAFWEDGISTSNVWMRHLGGEPA